jgi:pyruvate dehydrogenase E1 component
VGVTELHREGMAAERWSRLHPAEDPRPSFVEQCLAGRPGPAIASTDYVRSFADQIRPMMGGRRYEVLGTDGFGRSEYRVKLRRFFEVDRHHVAVAALEALAREGTVDSQVAQQAIERYELDADAAPPWTR